MIDNGDTPTSSDIIRAGADVIETHGWFKLEDICSTDYGTYCAITSMAHAAPYHIQERIQAIIDFGNLLGLAPEEPNSAAIMSISVACWNDSQESGDVVIAKMREVADQLEGKG